MTPFSSNIFPFLFYLLAFRADLMEQMIDFTIEGFKLRKHGPRSDKGKTHNYPKVRKKGSS
jgi:hypothetical protein